jgi:hypothetical protein
MSVHLSGSFHCLIGNLTAFRPPLPLDCRQGLLSRRSQTGPASSLTPASSSERDWAGLERVLAPYLR